MTCPGMPFAEFCCDLHDEQEVRRIAAFAIAYGLATLRMLAANAGIAHADMVRFLVGDASLTRTLRSRIVARCQEAA